jgi:HlyD family secretion protein
MMKKIIALVIVLGLIAGGVVWWRKRAASSVAHPEVKTATAETSNVRSTVSATGVLEAFKTIDVKSKAGGKVIRMAVEEGTRVKPGDLICLIDRTDNEAVYNQAESDVNAGLAAVEQARQSLNFTSTTLAPQIAQAEQSLMSARARLLQAEQSLDLQKQISEMNVAEAEQAVKSAKARLDQAETQAVTQPTLTQAAIAQAEATVRARKADVKGAEQSLQNLRTATQPQELAQARGTLESAKSDVKTAESNLERTKGLLTKGFASQSQVDMAENQLVAAQGRLQAAEAKIEVIKEEHATQIRELEARVEQAKATLSQSEASLANTKANAIQDDIRKRERDATLASYEQAKVALDNAKANRKQVDVKQADVDAAQAAVKQAEASLKAVRANAINNRVRQQDVQQAMARLVRAQVAARNAKVNLDQTTVLAPREGVVVTKLVDEGTIIQSGLSAFSAGSPIVQIADTSRMFVDAQVDEADIALIEEGQSVFITLDAYPNSPKAGKVRKVFPITEVVQNVTYIHVQVEIDPADVDERLRPGMNATCEFLVEEVQNVLTVPSEAVKDVGDQTEVTVIKNMKEPLWEETNQEKRKVEVGLRGDEKTEIKEGLKQGENVVTQIIQPITAQSGGFGGGGGGAPRGPTGGFGRGR